MPALVNPPPLVLGCRKSTPGLRPKHLRVDRENKSHREPSHRKSQPSPWRVPAGSGRSSKRTGASLTADGLLFHFNQGVCPMKINTLKLIYFSPTGTTRKVLEAIARGVGAESLAHLDLTSPVAETGVPAVIDDDLVIFGVPVYTGRVAQTAVDRLGPLKTSLKTPAVLVAVYGNRACEDALLELKDLVEAAGFAPVAAGTFIGEHSFANAATPIACGRPDGKDLEEAISFGILIRDKMKDAKKPDGLRALQVPGNSPYRERTRLPEGSPVTEKTLCILCGTCAEACPTGVITVNDTVTTDAANCIYCCACVKDCPTEARVMAVPVITQIAERLSKGCVERKSPEIFL